MGIKINSISFTPELSTNTTDWLLGGITNKIVAEIDFEAEWIARAGATADDEDMIFAASDDTITWNGGLWEDFDFYVGDTITITGTVSNNANHTIESIDGNVLTVVGSLTDETSETAVVTGTKECSGISFRANLIENDSAESFNSLVDLNEIKFTHDDIDYNSTTPLTLEQQGIYKSNNLGGATIEGLASPQLNRFLITHTFYINPFFLLAQLGDIQNGIAPDYFFDLTCLKYVYNMKLHYELSDPNRIHQSTDESLIGNTGWFNENFNGGISKFSIDPIVYKIGGVVVDNPDFNLVTDVEITINSEDGVFSNNNTKFVLNHFILPETEDQYVNTTTDMTTNFMFDRVLQTVGSAAVNGDNNGTAKQVLTNIAATYVSVNEVLITAKLDLSSAYKTRISALSNRRFILSVSVQDHTKQTEVSDLVVLMDEVDSYTTDLSNENVGYIENTITQFPGNAVCSQSMFVEDTLRLNSIFYVDITNDAIIEEVSVNIDAVKTGESFNLESKTFSFAGAIIQSGVQQINIEESRGFILGSGNPFNVVSLKRRSDLDSGNNKYYELIYSFKIRWEDFIKLTGVSSDFYDVAEPFNGFNNDWNRYFIGSGWSIELTVQANIEENGFVNEITDVSTLQAYTYDDSLYWSQQIQVFDIDSGDEITGYVLTDDIVQIKATFTKNVGDIPLLTEVHGMIEVEPFEQGGINVIRNINTSYAHEYDSPFISVTGLSDGLLKKEKAGNVFTFTANIDGSKLSGMPKISARIYDFTCIPQEMCAKQFQDDADMEFQDEAVYEFQDGDDACDCIFLLDSCNIPNPLFAFATYILKTGITSWGSVAVDSIAAPEGEEGGIIPPAYITSLVDQSGNGITCLGNSNPPAPSRETMPEPTDNAAKFYSEKRFNISTGASESGDFSLYFTVKSSTLTTANDTILLFTDLSIIVSINSGAINVFYNNSAQTLTKSGLSNETEYRVLVERDGSDINLIVDNVVEDTNSSDTAFTIDSASAMGLDSTLREVRSRALIMWDYVLSAGQKTTLFS